MRRQSLICILYNEQIFHHFLSFPPRKGIGTPNEHNVPLGSSRVASPNRITIRLRFTFIRDWNCIGESVKNAGAVVAHAERSQRLHGHSRSYSGSIYEPALITPQRLRTPIRDGPGMVHDGPSRTAEVFRPGSSGVVKRGFRAIVRSLHRRLLRELRLYF